MSNVVEQHLTQLCLAITVIVRNKAARPVVVHIDMFRSKPAISREWLANCQSCIQLHSSLKPLTYKKVPRVHPFNCSWHHANDCKHKTVA